MDFGGMFTNEIEPTVPVDDLSPHVGGAPSGRAAAAATRSGVHPSGFATNAAASADDVTTLHWAVGIVVVALVALYLLGGIVFRSFRF